MGLTFKLGTAPQVSTNYIPKSSSNSFINSLIWDNGTNVGIGNTNTTYTFDVTGTGRFTGALTLDAAANIIKSGNDLRFNRADNAIYTQLYDAGSGAANGFILNNTNSEGFHFKNGSTTIMRMNSAGNVGIGTSSPQRPLEVVGTIRNTNPSGSNFSQIYNDATGAWWSTGAYPMMFETNSTERMRITTAGRLLINTTSSTQGMLYMVAGANTDGITSEITTSGYTAFVSRVPASSYSAYWVCGGNTAGYINHPTTTTTNYYTGPSDLRLKSNIVDWNENVLELFTKIKPKIYNHIADNDESIKYKGFIAQEMVDKFPEAYQEDKEGFYANNPIGFIPYLVKAIQELNAKVSALESRS